jgi:hypothetical protein
MKVISNETFFNYGIYECSEKELVEINGGLFGPFRNFYKVLIENISVELIKKYGEDAVKYHSKALERERQLGGNGGNWKF